MLAVLALLAAAPYANTLRNDFVLDDVLMIVENPLIRDVGNAGKMFATNYWSRGQENPPADTDPGLYRPLTVFTYALDYAAWKLNPAGYHFVNLLLHAAATLLLFLVAVEILQSPIAAFAAAALFAVHPIHTEAVTGIVGRAEILATLFFLLAFWLGAAAAFEARSRAGVRAAALPAAAALAYLLGLFAKETAVTLPAVQWVYDWMGKKNLLQGSARRPAGNALPRYAAFGGALLIYFVFRARAVSATRGWIGFEGVGAVERVLTASRVLMEYVGLLLFPYTLRADYWKADAPIAESPFEPLVFLSLVLWVIVGIVAVRSFRRAPALFFSLAWFFITILPVSNLLLPIGVIKAERILYLPSAGFCLCAGWLVARLEEKIRRPWLVALPLVPILAVLAVRTHARNADWKDTFTLALATLKVSPTSPWSNRVAALEYRKRGVPDKTIALLQAAIREIPQYPPFFFELGATLEQQGRLDEAIEAYRRALTLYPNYWEARESLGGALLKKNQPDAALREFAAIAAARPNHRGARVKLGNAYLTQGLVDQAIEQYRQAIALAPDDAEAHTNLGAAYFSRNRIDDAVSEFAVVVKLSPAGAEARNNLAGALFRKGRLDEAVAEYREALRLKADYPEARKNLDLALRQKAASAPRP